MPLPVPPDLEDALAASPRARATFASLTPEQKDAWIGWVNGGRGRRARAGRVAEAVRRLGGGAAAAETVVEGREPPPRPAPVPPREWWPWLLLLLLLVIAGLLALWFFAIRDHGHAKTTVPAVVGMQRPQAEARIRARKLRSSVQTVQNPKPSGVVITQEPGAGKQVNTKSVVHLTVSKGPATVAVPDVVGQTTATATQRLTSAGFATKVVLVGSQKKVGTVTAQDPPAGAQAKKGSTIRINVSKGPKKKAVPDVVGQQQAAAVKALRAAGFAVNVAKVPSPQPAGTVTAQQPQAATQALEGSTVRINVSKGGAATTATSTTATTATTRTVTTATTRTATTTTATRTTPTPALVRVPRVVGLQQRAATRRLHASGLRAAIAFVTSSQPAGRVIAQQPAQGTQLRKGARVRLSVSEGPNPRPLKAVPDVVGQDQATATSTLQSAGFTVDAIPQPTTDQSQDGIVIDEQPAGGTQAPQGSVITIYVGQFTG